jgi:hypothetical protein
MAASRVSDAFEIADAALVAADEVQGARLSSAR